MKRHLILILFFIFCFSTLADAQLITRWQGTTSFQVKITFLVEDSLGNVKFDKTKNKFRGVVDLTTSDRNLVPDLNGCLLTFTGDDGTRLCVTEAVFPTENDNNTKSDDLLLIGIGDFVTVLEGGLFAGIGYVDAEGVIKQSKDGDDLSITLKGTLSGGSEAARPVKTVTFSGNFQTVLKPVD